MTWAYVLRPREMATYRRCRRAWDFGARIRQNYIPALPPRVFDFDKAVHDALAVYYFPAMDDWDRSIVRPLALKGFFRSMEEDRARYETQAALTPGQEEEWEEAIERGQAMLNGYFTWAAPLDTFASIFSDQEFWAPIPDPANPGSDLVNHAGREIRYLGRVDHLFSDHNDEYWICDHRIIGNEWEDDDQLLLDLEGVAALWATELTYPQLRIAGTVYNELRTTAEDDPSVDRAEGFEPQRGPGGPDPEAGRAHRRDGRTMRHIHTRRSPMTPEVPVSIEDQDLAALATVAPFASEEGQPVDHISIRETGEWFRRTYVRRGRTSVRNIGLMMAALAAEVANPALPVYPNPAPDNCSTCVFRAPCVALNEGADPAPILEASFRRRTEEEGEEERLRWSIGRA
ncbi:MAG TPA: hypothetical protein VKL22_02470, partial [Actinomycetota bacterium]|nr:hypothetical protein [Actinomycetota bacterium]